MTWDDSFDVVVIGSGLSGLTCAVGLASEGRRVAVCEAHYVAGGYLHAFQRHGVRFDTGFHYTGGVQAGGMLRRSLSALGVWGAVPFVPLDPDGFDVLHLPLAGGERLDHRIPVGPERWRRRLEDRWPAAAPALRRYFAQMQRVAEAAGLDDPSRTDPEVLVPAWEHSLADLLERCGIPAGPLRACLVGQSVLYGLPSSRAPAALHLLIQRSYLDGAWAIEGGGQVLADALVARLRALDGTLLLRSPVSRIEVTGGRASGVLAGAQRLAAREAVISTASPASTVALLPPSTLRPGYRRRLARARPGISAVGLYRASDEPWHAPRRNHYCYSTPDPDQIYASTDARQGHAFLTRRSHPSGSTLLGLQLAEWRDWSRWQGTRPRPADYLAARSEAADRMEALARGVWPDLGPARPGGTWASSPLTHARFTRNPEGALYGSAHDLLHSGRRAPGPRTRLPGLLLSGHHLQLPGVLGVTFTAWETLGCLLGAERVRQRLTSA